MYTLTIKYKELKNMGKTAHIGLACYNSISPLQAYSVISAFLASDKELIKMNLFYDSENSMKQI